MELFFTDDSFVVEGLPRPGVPFLCNEEMDLVTSANRWLRHVAIIKGRTRSPQTRVPMGPACMSSLLR